MCSVKEKDTETFPHELSLIFQRLWGFHFFQPSFQLLFYCFALLKRNSAWCHHLPYLPFFFTWWSFFFLSTFMFDSEQSQQYKEKFNIGHCQRLQVKQGIIIFAVVFLEYSIVSFPMTALFFWISCLLSRSSFLRLMCLVFFATVLRAFELRNASPHNYVCIWSSCLILIETIYLTWVIVTSKYIGITFISSITSDPLQFW